MVNKLLPGKPATHMANAAPLIQLIANALGKAAEHVTSTWASAIHMGNQNEAPGSVLAQASDYGLWGVNQWMGEFSATPSFSVPLPFKS